MKRLFYLITLLVFPAFLKAQMQQLNAAEIALGIEKLNVKNGQFVNKGDLLVELNQDTFISDYNSALGNYQKTVNDVKNLDSSIENTRKILYNNELLNKRYEKENGTYGLTTLRKKHPKEVKTGLIIKYIGKSGKFRELNVVHPVLIKLLNFLPFKN